MLNDSHDLSPGGTAAPSLARPQDARALGRYTVAAGVAFGVMAACIPLLAAWSVPAMLATTVLLAAGLVGSMVVIQRRLRSVPRGFSASYLAGFLGSAILYDVAVVVQANGWVTPSAPGIVGIAVAVATPGVVAGALILRRGPR